MFVFCAISVSVFICHYGSCSCMVFGITVVVADAVLAWGIAYLLLVIVFIFIYFVVVKLRLMPGGLASYIGRMWYLTSTWYYF